MFEAYFFDKRATINYRVYRVLKALQNTAFTVNKLSQEAQLSYSQTYNAFQDIMADLQTMSPKTVSTADEEAFNILAQNVSVDQYRFYLLNNAMAFAFFDYLFKTPTPDVHDFCTEHDISISTLRRRVEPFKAYLQSKGVTLNTSAWGLEGSELRIRMVILNFFILGYRGAGWPLGNADYELCLTECSRIARTYQGQWFTADPSLAKQDLLAMMVQHMRMQQGNVLPQEVAFTRLTQAPGAQVLPDVIQADKAWVSTNESGFFYFCRIHFLSLGTKPTAADHWLIDHFQRRDSVVAHFADGLINYLVAQNPELLAVTTRDSELLRANLYRITYSYWLFGGDFSKRLDFYDEDRNAAAFGRLPALIDTYFQNLEGDAAAMRPYQGIMRRIIYGVVRDDFPELDADHQLSVAVLIEPGTFTLRDILHFLDGISFVKLAENTQHPDADVIITTLTSSELIDQYYGNDHAPLIQWQTIAQEEDYYRLYAELMRRHEEKNAQAATAG